MKVKNIDEILGGGVKLLLFSANNNDEVKKILDDSSKSFADNTKYEFCINIKYDGGNYLTGGTWHIQGVKTNANYEYQVATRYGADGVTEKKRSKISGSWKVFV